MAKPKTKAKQERTEAINIKVTPDMKSGLIALAEKNFRNLSLEIIVALERHLSIEAK